MSHTAKSIVIIALVIVSAVLTIVGLRQVERQERDSGVPAEQNNH